MLHPSVINPKPHVVDNEAFGTCFHIVAIDVMDSMIFVLITTNTTKPPQVIITYWLQRCWPGLLGRWPKKDTEPSYRWWKGTYSSLDDRIYESKSMRLWRTVGHVSLIVCVCVCVCVLLYREKIIEWCALMSPSSKIIVQKNSYSNFELILKSWSD